MSEVEKRKTRNAQAAASNPGGRPAHLLVVPRSKTTVSKGAAGKREQLTGEELQLLQKLVYGNRKKKSSFFHHLLLDAKLVEAG